MPLPRRTFAATATVALLAAAGVTAAVAADPAPAPPPAIAFLANGRVPADALAAGPIAGQLGAPIYTTEQASLPDSTATALDTGDPELVIVLGGPVAISDHVIDQVETATGLAATDQPTPAGGIVRAAGPDRFATAAAVADLLAAYDPAYLPVTAQAVDADTLDGQHSSAFQPAGDYLPASTGAFAPVALIKVWVDGSIMEAGFRQPVTSEPTAARTGVGAYQIGLPGASLSTQNDFATCTPATGVPTLITTQMVAGNLRVETYDADGAAMDAVFTCAIYLR